VPERSAIEKEAGQMPTQATVGKVRSADGTSIAFERTGTGPALILVDAALGFRGFGPMGELAGLLSGDFTVVTYDRRGRGESTDTQPYAVDREVEDLAVLIEEVGGSAFVYGFSSGAVLGLHAAARGLLIPKLVLLEPPIPLEDQPEEGDLGAEIEELVAAGKRGDAVEHFNRSIGVPEEMVAGMRGQPFWPTLEEMAHTLVYDTTITGSITPELLSSINTPTLVVGSEASGDYLQSSGRRVAEALPGGRFVALKGEWHGVPLDDLAPVITEFLEGQEPT
jgi:pimeloyl-ACP methyl ester carboxylesterase